ncbi:hypothetical protein [Actinacidiphila paucisporea]|uniref:Lipoprotein n=1 Tax=Actinacidiphila paucisporea TaxID=310782 RepID=A0A1M7PXV6_9ACTN|nr:hypothetical protein [Actinacidiphila paucisporea]SHN22550.1 hypothetical protein SAMN05216499_12715 [Actinacidiphila paucisporea]
MPQTSTTFRIVLRSALALICATAAAGCGGSWPPSTTSSKPVLTVAQPAPSHIPTLTTTSGLSLPIEAYLVPPENYTQMLRADAELVRQCMARYGFEYTPPDFSGPESSLSPTNMSRRYGVADLSSVGTYGYHKPQTKTTRKPAASRPMSESARLVFLGDSPGSGFEHKSQVYQGRNVPKGGCSGEAQRKLGAGLNERLAEDINDASYQQSLANPTVLASFTKWSACMKQSGYSLSTPAQAPGFTLPEAPTAAEIQQAKADVTCKTRTNIVGVWFTVESAIQQGLIARNEEALTDLKVAEQSTLKKAGQVLQKT